IDARVMAAVAIASSRELSMLVMPAPSIHKVTTAPHTLGTTGIPTRDTTVTSQQPRAPRAGTG
ncbi:hypothetical protein MCOR15_011612, partial [Pyricularia oryzae]